MKRRQVPLWFFLSVVIVLLAAILVGITIVVKQDKNSKDLNWQLDGVRSSWSVDIVENRFGLPLSEYDMSAYEYYHGVGYLSTYEVTYLAYAVPLQGMSYFEDKMLSIGMSEYTPDMFDELSENHIVWNGFDDIVRFDLQDVEHGYFMFIGGAIFRLSDGSEPIRAEEALLFYDADAGRLYLYMQNSMLFLF